MGLEVIDVGGDLDDAQGGEGHRVLRVHLHGAVEGDLGLGKIAEAVVTKSHGEPDVTRRARVFSDYGFNIGQTLLPVAAVEFDDGLGEEAEHGDSARYTLAGRFHVSNLLLTGFAIRECLFQLTGGNFIKAHTN